jgi:hypothetical protein
MLKLLINSVFLMQNRVRIVFSDKVLVNSDCKTTAGTGCSMQTKAIHAGFGMPDEKGG